MIGAISFIAVLVAFVLWACCRVAGIDDERNGRK